MACVLRWRELSRNKSRDEREMWPNRTAHTDIPWLKKERGGDAIAAGSSSSRSALIARPPFHSENFRVTTRSLHQRSKPVRLSLKMNLLCIV